MPGTAPAQKAMAQAAARQPLTPTRLHLPPTLDPQHPLKLIEGAVIEPDPHGRERLRQLGQSLAPKKATTVKKSSHPAKVYQPPTTKSGQVLGDDTSDPFVISSFPYSTTGTTEGFTDDYDTDCNGTWPGTPDVVYSYHSDTDHLIRVDLCNSSYDTRVWISSGSDAFNVLACNDDACGGDGVQSRIDCYPMQAGDDILIIVDGYGGDYGNYELDLYDCDGENIDDPFVIPSLPYFSVYTTEGANNDYDEACPDASTSGDRVYAFTPDQDMQVTIDLCNSTYDTKLFVYENTATPGSPYACNDDACGVDGFRSKLECLPLTGGSTYYFVVDGYGNQTGPYQLEVSQCGGPGCWTGCDPDALLEGEGCPAGDPDVYNGGCASGGYFMEIDPFVNICGTAGVDGTYDSDWYARQLFEGDSVTWCVVPHFPARIGIVDVTNGCAGWDYLATATGNCDTLYAGARISQTGYYAFVVTPDIGVGGYPCALDPEYQAQLRLVPNCQWGGCPYVSTPEGEDCVTFAPDNFNGGCLGASPHFSVVPDNQYICGGTWELGGNDTDWYLRHLNAGEKVTFAGQGNLPLVFSIIALQPDCSHWSYLAWQIVDPCQVAVVSATAPSTGDYACVVWPYSAPNRYSCDMGPWQYTAVINPGPECGLLTCSPGATIESEPCLVTATQGYNAGCNSNPPTYATINYGETVCGSVWYATAGYNQWRDTEWHDADVADGDSVVWRVTADFKADVWILDVPNDCNFLNVTAVDQDSVRNCDTVYVSCRKQPGQNLRFVLAPSFWSLPIWCELGDRRWQATLTKAGNACACRCAHDPRCDGVTDILDVTTIINVAFRDGAPIPDSNANCPRATTDVDCSGATDILDVTKMINVAFRDGSPAVNFCDPCNQPTLSSPARRQEQ
jgi:hypothetical protein